MRHRYLAEKINTNCNAPTKGANTINGSPSLPPNLASTTTEPVANTTTMNVPITSATNLFWEEVSLDAILSLEALSNFSNSSFYLVSNLSDLLNRLTFWVFNSPINDVVYEKHWTFRPLYAAHVYGFCRSLNHILCNQLGFLTADIDSSF